MSRRYIDFISAYCDRWCERCDFTERCSAFAVHAAVAMCDGDEDAALELAIGPSRSPGGATQKNLSERMAEMMAGYEEPSEKELEEIGQEMDARRDRIEHTRLAQTSDDYGMAAHRWLVNRDDLQSNTDAKVRDAFDVVSWDSHLIHAKVMRALSGRDEDPLGRFWRSRVQNDWNGSAKVALISIERSERAWRAIADATRDEGAVVLADGLVQLRNELLREFPRAMAFQRPGFDGSRPGHRNSS